MLEFNYTKEDKQHFDGLPCSEFVLDQRNALKYLRYMSDLIIEQGFNNEQDSESVSADVEDIIDMARRIIEEDLEFVKFVECPMSASGVNIVPMVEKGE